MSEVVLSHPLSAGDAYAIGLEQREYRVGEVISVDPGAAWQMTSYGLATPATGTAAEPAAGSTGGGGGESAYDIARRYGFVGTEQQWLTSLRGADGEVSALTVGNVVTLPTGTPATANVRGEPPVQFLDLGIPAGPGGTAQMVDASAVAKGVIKLAGDLGGTSDAPTVPGLATKMNRGEVVGGSGGAIAALGDVSGAVALNLTNNDAFTMRLTGATTLSVSGWPSQLVSRTILVYVRQDSTGGRTLTWPSTFALPTDYAAPQTAPDSLAIWELTSPDAGQTVLVRVRSTFATRDRYDEAVVALGGLRYYWPMEEAAGTAAADVSGLNRPGTYSGSPLLADAALLPTSVRKTPRLNASGMVYRDDQAFAAAGFSSAWSLGFIMKAPDPGNANGSRIYNEASSTNANPTWWLGAAEDAAPYSQLQLFWRNDANGTITLRRIAGTAFDDAVHLIVVSYNGAGQFTVFKDGVQVDQWTTTGSGAATVDRATWGARRASDITRTFAGYLGRVWARTRATTAAEVAALWAAAGSPTAPTTPPTGGGGGTTTPPTTTTPTFDANGVQLAAPTVTVSGSSFTVSAPVKTDGRTLTPVNMQVAVRSPSGVGADTAFAPGTPISGTPITLAGSGTAVESGTWKAYTTYTLVANPAQSDWKDGPVTTFTVDTTTAPPPSTGGGGSTTTGKWLSGAGGTEAANGSFGTWRGRPIDIGTTWMYFDQLTNIQPGQEWGSFMGPMDIAVPSFPTGGNWGTAATGGYDTYWRSCVTNLKNLRAGRGTTYLRMAYEFNGDWMNWSAPAGQEANFKAAWRRFAAIARSIFPEMKLVLCHTWDGKNGEVRNFFPGADVVDIIGVDYYLFYPHPTDAAGIQAHMNSTGFNGGPRGLERWRQWAESVGLPVCICEWSNQGDPGSQGGGGEAPLFMDAMNTWMRNNAGTGPGKLIYDTQFNLWPDQYQLYAQTRQPQTAARYRQLIWGQ